MVLMAQEKVLHVIISVFGFPQYSLYSIGTGGEITSDAAGYFWVLTTSTHAAVEDPSRVTVLVPPYIYNVNL